MRQVICDRCREPIDRGQHAADGFAVELGGFTVRLSIEPKPGEPRADLHQACLRAMIGALPAAVARRRDAEAELMDWLLSGEPLSWLDAR